MKSHITKRLIAVALLTRPFRRSMALSTDTKATSHYQVRTEPTKSGAMPIFAATPEVVGTLLDVKNKDDVCLPPQEYPDGVFVLPEVLTRDECQRMIQISEEMGYSEDAPVSLGRNIRRNENVVWIMDHDINQRIFERSRLPSSLEFRGHNLGAPVGLNRRWRLYKYNPNDVFRFHTDGAWTGSGIDLISGEYENDLYNGTALSFMTYLIYLDDDFEGGSTAFRRSNGDIFHVQPSQGSVLCFYHGHHPLSLQHEGSLVSKGTKYVARTDVLYQLPHNL
jgi:hypothetical protein